MERKTMISNLKKIIIVIFFMILATSIYCYKTICDRRKLDAWTGQYSFTETFEHNSGEINYYVDYEIIIYRDGGRYYAELEGDGWFLQTRSLAYIEGDENSIDIIFKSGLPGDSLYGQAERYEADELMLTLSYDASELISTWHALRKEHPILAENADEIKGIYFEKMYERRMRIKHHMGMHKRIAKKSFKKCAIILSVMFIALFLLALAFHREKERNRKELDTWLGVYSYFEFYKFDDEKVQVDFELIIYEDEGSYYAEFKNDGKLFEKDGYSVLLQSRSLAYIKGNEESIAIYFKSTLPGDSLYGISERYKRNELLLTLTYKDAELQTTWYAMQGEEPVLRESQEKIEGAYFTASYLSGQEHAPMAILDEKDDGYYAFVLVRNNRI